jgi:hypothetical protein
MSPPVLTATTESIFGADPGKIPEKTVDSSEETVIGAPNIDPNSSTQYDTDS